MPRLKLELNSETYGRLIHQAAAERRDVVGQAEVVIMRSLGQYPCDECTALTTETTAGTPATSR